MRCRLIFTVTALWAALPALAHDETHGGCRLSAEQANRAEERVRRNPEDLLSRAQLVAYYYCRGNLNEPTKNPAAHLKHVLWLIQHHPECPVLALGEANLDPGYNRWASRESYERVKKLWLSAVARYPRKANIIANAAQCCEYSDARISTDLWRRALALEPNNQEYATSLGHALATATLRIKGFRDGNPIVPDHPTAEDLETAEQAKTIASESRNPYVMAEYGSGLRVPEYLATAKTYLEKALRLVPSNEWKNVLYEIRRDSGEPILENPHPTEEQLHAKYLRYHARLKARPLPRFSQYPVAEVFKGKPVRPKIELAPDEDGDRVDSAVLQEYEKGPDFAGSYRFAESTCGSSCLVTVLIDIRTGRVFDTPFSYWGNMGFFFGFLPEPEMEKFKPLDYRLNSNLIIANGCPEDENCGTYVYRWDGTRFVLLRRVLIDR